MLSVVHVEADCHALRNIVTLRIKGELDVRGLSGLHILLNGRELVDNDIIVRELAAVNDALDHPVAESAVRHSVAVSIHSRHHHLLCAAGRSLSLADHIQAVDVLEVGIDGLVGEDCRRIGRNTHADRNHITVLGTERHRIVKLELVPAS